MSNTNTNENRLTNHTGSTTIYNNNVRQKQRESLYDDDSEDTQSTQSSSEDDEAEQEIYKEYNDDDDDDELQNDSSNNEEVDQDPELEEDDDTCSELSIPDPNIDFDMVYALHTFTATVEGQATVVRGDALTLLDDSNSYWWLVKVLKTAVVGYIPAENIETPFERLARLNSHRNVELTRKDIQDAFPDPPPSQSKSNKRVTLAKGVQFQSQTIYGSTDDEDDFEAEFDQWNERMCSDDSSESESSDSDDPYQYYGGSRNSYFSDSQSMDVYYGNQQQGNEDNESLDGAKKVNSGRSSILIPEDESVDYYEYQYASDHSEATMNSLNENKKDAFNLSDETISISLTPPIARDSSDNRRSDSSIQMTLRKVANLEKLLDETFEDSKQVLTEKKEKSGLRKLFSRNSSSSNLSVFSNSSAVSSNSKKNKLDVDYGLERRLSSSSSINDTLSVNSTMSYNESAGQTDKPNPTNVVESNRIEVLPQEEVMVQANVSPSSGNLMQTVALDNLNTLSYTNNISNVDSSFRDDTLSRTDTLSRADSLPHNDTQYQVKSVSYTDTLAPSNTSIRSVSSVSSVQTANSIHSVNSVPQYNLSRTDSLAQSIRSISSAQTANSIHSVNSAPQHNLSRTDSLAQSIRSVSSVQQNNLAHTDSLAHSIRSVNSVQSFSSTQQTNVVRTESPSTDYGRSGYLGRTESLAYKAPSSQATIMSRSASLAYVNPNLARSANLTQSNSPSRIDSLGRVESPSRNENLNRVDSPSRFDSLGRVGSPLLTERVANSSRTDSLTRKDTRTDNLVRTDSLSRTDSLTHSSNSSRPEQLIRTDSLTRKESLNRSGILTRKESLSRSDSLTRKESLSRKESLNRTDSLSRKGSLSRKESLQRSNDPVSLKVYTTPEGDHKTILLYPATTALEALQQLVVDSQVNEQAYHDYYLWVKTWNGDEVTLLPSDRPLEIYHTFNHQTPMPSLRKARRISQLMGQAQMTEPTGQPDEPVQFFLRSKSKRVDEGEFQIKVTLEGDNQVDKSVKLSSTIDVKGAITLLLERFHVLNGVASAATAAETESLRSSLRLDGDDEIVKYGLSIVVQGQVRSLEADSLLLDAFEGNPPPILYRRSSNPDRNSITINIGPPDQNETYFVLKRLEPESKSHSRNHQKPHRLVRQNTPLPRQEISKARFQPPAESMPLKSFDTRDVVSSPVETHFSQESMYKQHQASQRVRPSSTMSMVYCEDFGMNDLMVMIRGAAHLEKNKTQKNYNKRSSYTIRTEISDVFKDNQARLDQLEKELDRIMSESVKVYS